MDKTRFPSPLPSDPCREEPQVLLLCHALTGTTNEFLGLISDLTNQQFSDATKRWFHRLLKEQNKLNLPKRKHKRAIPPEILFDSLVLTNEGGLLNFIQKLLHFEPFVDPPRPDLRELELCRAGMPVYPVELFRAATDKLMK